MSQEGLPDAVQLVRRSQEGGENVTSVTLSVAYNTATLTLHHVPGPIPLHNTAIPFFETSMHFIVTGRAQSR